MPSSHTGSDFWLVSEDAAGRRLFRQYLQQHHYLDHRAPYGAQLRYWVRAAQLDLPPLAALLFTGAAWRMAPRDRYIGWSEPFANATLRVSSTIAGF